MFCIVVLFGLASVLATFQKIGQFFFQIIWSPWHQSRLYFARIQSYKTFYCEITMMLVVCWYLRNLRDRFVMYENGRHEIQHNNTQHNDIQHNDAQHKRLKCDTQQKWQSAKTTLSVITYCHYGECRVFLLLCWLALCWVSWRPEMGRSYGKLEGFVAMVSHFHWIQQTQAHYGICSLRIVVNSLVFVLKVCNCCKNVSRKTSPATLFENALPY